MACLPVVWFTGAVGGSSRILYRSALADARARPRELRRCLYCVTRVIGVVDLFDCACGLWRISSDDKQ